MYLYLLGAYRRKDRNPQAVKIGVAINPQERLLALQTGNHLQLRIIATWKAKSALHAYDVESFAHRRFRNRNLSGEWFTPHIPLILDFMNTHVTAHEYIDQREIIVSENLDTQLLCSSPI